MPICPSQHRSYCAISDTAITDLVFSDIVMNDASLMWSSLMWSLLNITDVTTVVIDCRATSSTPVITDVDIAICNIEIVITDVSSRSSGGLALLTGGDRTLWPTDHTAIRR